MSLDRLLTLFYRLPLKLISQGFAVASLLFLLVHHRYGGCRRFRAGLAALLGLWLGVVLWSTVLGRGGSADHYTALIPFHSYLQVFGGGNPELLRANFMNAALFFPGGLLTAALLPKQWPGRRRLLAVIGIYAFLSVGIEFCQYRFSLGETEMDDVLHNTLGAVLGGLPIVLEDILA